jgi:hypothetical protein
VAATDGYLNSDSPQVLGIGLKRRNHESAYLDEHHIAAHNRRYARPAAEAADYHRRRPTQRQLDQVFWLEEDRVVSEDWVVRYKNRLLQLERQSPPPLHRLETILNCRTMIFQRTATTPLTPCLSLRVHSILPLCRLPRRSEESAQKMPRWCP